MILLVAEHGSEAALRASREVLALAQTLGSPVSVVIPGLASDAAATELSQADVLDVVRLEHEGLAQYTNSAFVQALAAYIEAAAPSLVLLPHTYRTRDFAPRLAARLNTVLLTDCTAVARHGEAFVFTRPIFQGKLLAEVTSESPRPFASIQIGAFRADALRLGTSPAPIRHVAASLTPSATPGHVRPPFRQTRDAVDLSKAERIVAVGRGFKDETQLALARDLATALGAEIAASRPICDSGWLPLDRQVGSSGQTVAPRLYLALGISGAIQHVVGMKGARTIVAINKDADAPIFEVAHYGIVGDIFEVVPAMIAALNDTSGTPR